MKLSIQHLIDEIYHYNLYDFINPSVEKTIIELCHKYFMTENMPNNLFLYSGDELFCNNYIDIPIEIDLNLWPQRFDSNHIIKNIFKKYSQNTNKFTFLISFDFAKVETNYQIIYVEINLMHSGGVAELYRVAKHFDDTAEFLYIFENISRNLFSGYSGGRLTNFEENNHLEILYKKIIKDITCD